MSRGQRVWAWAPALLLTIGVGIIHLGIQEQRRLPLRAPLDASVPSLIQGFRGTDVTISAKERRVAGMDSYVLRNYAPDGAASAGEAFSIYVGYYGQQMQGKTIHSPKNCLPGGGWEPLTQARREIRTPTGPVPVNRYLIQNGTAQALVLYWYQGRGRVEASEYKVKWHLLRDQALHGRSDEALVRIIVPVASGELEAYRLAEQVAATLVPAVANSLPG